jgi:cadmium-exporting ATPase
VFMRPSLTAIAHILDLSKSTLRVAWQNVVFAIAVKILIMLLGILGYASMWWAVFGDTGVSILCILNSVRILSRK